jgi:hypothetical protein
MSEADPGGEAKAKLHRKNMCVLCFNSQWRSVVIGTVSTVLSLSILLFTIGYYDQIIQHLANKVAEKRCYTFSNQPQETKKVNWSRTLKTHENECVFLAFTTLFPWPLWATLATYVILNVSLIVSAVYK